jgi:hypothetical protein
LITRRKENPRAALRAIRAARLTEPDNPALALAAAECYEALNESGLAKREYELAASLDPSLKRARDWCNALDRSEEVARSIANAILNENEGA